ncbi:MAG: lactate racemase domain-containing protein [Candidatus Bathyarchaeia archaeon]
MVDVWLPYGNTEVCIRVPAENLQNIVRIKEKVSAKKIEDEVRGSLENPIGSRRLSEVVRPGERVALVLSASEAPVIKPIVPLVLEEMSRAGLKSSDLTVIVAQDLFRSEAEGVLGQLKNDILSFGANMIIHDFSSETIPIGEFGSGIKIHINRVFAESKVRISASLVEPDPYMLYRWGGSSILLGLSSIETVRQILSPALNLDNPSDLIFKGIFEASSSLDITFAINIVRNIKGGIVGLVSGDFERCLQESIRIADEIYRVSVEKRADVVFISPGGSPFDASLFEACRCLENALRISKRDGVIILAAECSGGYGRVDFHEALSKFRGDPKSLERSLQKRFTIGGFVACRFLRVLRGANIGMVSALPDFYISEMEGLKVFRTANEALTYALERSGRRSKVSFIPHGNLTLPTIEEGER